MNFSSPAELRLEDVSYEWLDTCQDERMLKTAIRLIEEDGDYFLDLKKAVQKKLLEVNPQLKQRSEMANKISEEEMLQELNDLNNWKIQIEAETSRKEESKTKISANDRKMAENEKNKGNEALTANDFKEAIGFYNNAIKIDPTNAIYFGNRSQAFLKLKDYRKVVEDSSTAVSLDSSFVKGYYRRSVANENLGNYFSSACDLTKVLFLDKMADKSIATKLDQLRAKLSDAEKDSLSIFEKRLTEPVTQTQKEAPSKLVKINIEEDDDDEEDIETKNKVEQLTKEKNTISKKIENGDYLSSVKDLQELLEKINKLKKTDDAEYLRLTTISNIAFCYKKSELNNEAIHNSYEVINYLWKKYEDRVISERELDLLLKALLRRGLSYESVERPDSAYKDYSRALLINPNYTQALNHRNKVSSYVSTTAKNEFELFKKQSFEKMEKNYQKPTTKDSSQSCSDNNSKDKNDNETPLNVQSPLENITQPDTQVNCTPSLVRPEKNHEQQNLKDEPKPINETVPSGPNQNAHEEADEAPCEKVKLEVKLSEHDRKFIASKKKQGNEFFEKKNYKSAASHYLEALSAFPNLDEMFTIDNQDDEKLFVDVCSNLSFTHFHLGEFSNGYKVAVKVLDIQPDNKKAKFRKVINAEGMIDQLMPSGKLKDKNSEQIEELVKEITPELPLLIRNDPKNEKLANLYKKIADLTFAFSKNRTTDKVQNNHVEVETAPVQKQTENITDKIQKNIREKIEKQTATITELAMQDILNRDSLPTNSSQFEIDLITFKDNAEYIFEYLAKMEIGYLTKLYQKKQLEFKYFIKIITAFKKVIGSDTTDAELWLVISLFLSQFIETFGAKLTLKMCLKKEKSILMDLVGKGKLLFPDLRNNLCRLENEII